MTDRTALIIGGVAAVALIIHNLPTLLISGGILGVLAIAESVWDGG